MCWKTGDRDPKTGDWDLDLQDQIGLETSKNFFVFIFLKILLFRILSSNLNCFLIIGMPHTILKTLDLDLQGQIGLEVPKFLF